MLSQLKSDKNERGSEIIPTDKICVKFMCLVNFSKAVDMADLKCVILLTLFSSCYTRTTKNVISVTTAHTTAPLKSSNFVSMDAI